MIQVNDVTKKFFHWKEPAISLKRILVNACQGKSPWRKRERFTVLESVSFNIFPGDFVGIMGRNGAGKSTLLKLISGIYKPSLGEIKVHGSIAPLIELGAGFHPDLSGYENIFLNAAILGFGRKATLEAAPSIVEFSELGDMINMPVKYYSSGMLIRLGFSIASHLDAPIILMDEVLSVGDIGFQMKSLKKVHSLHQEGRTIVLITHDPEQVKKHCNRCIVISNQKKIYDGDAPGGAEVYLKLVNESTPTPAST
jgi:ABC-type polysaccharide/polyol phosphate transport system ATPase subunit